MRVLWFTNVPLDAVNRRAGLPTQGSGFWMHALISPLTRSGKVKLAVVSASTKYPRMRFEEDGVEYFNIPQNRILEAFDLFPRARETRSLREAAALIDEWKPDLLHVYGTERFFGLIRARNLVQVPTVVQMQTVMVEYARMYWGSMTWRDVLRNTTLWEISRNATMPADARRHRRQAATERQILDSVEGVLGRTDWDRSHTHLINPGVPYFHVEDMMRPEFGLAEPWSLNTARRGDLITTSAPGAAKGVDVLLRAVHALRKWGHDVRLKVAGLSRSTARRASDRFLFKLVEELGLGDVVQFLGWRRGSELVSLLQESHCFITSSYIENGCNALSEAQLVGTPCVATHTGGMTTTIRDNHTGLLFSSGDAAMLAAKVEGILKDDALASRLGAEARREAGKRHDPVRIVEALMDTYERVAASQKPLRDVQ